MPSRIQTRQQGMLYVRNIPPALKAMFKAEVARRGNTIEQVIKTLLEKYMEDPSKFPVRNRRRENQWPDLPPE